MASKKTRAKGWTEHRAKVDRLARKGIDTWEHPAQRALRRKAREDAVPHWV